jgi:toxin ParE1/3/4
MAEVIWTEPALEQLDSIAEFIALDKPEAAQAVVRRVFAATGQVERFLRLGRPVPELPNPKYRQVWIKPCWLYYRIDKNQAYILHVRRGEKLLRIEDLISDE